MADMTTRAVRLAVAGLLAAIATAGQADAADRDFHSGIAYLRAGALADAERDLTRYRDEARDPVIRTRVDRVLPLLRRSLTPEVRDYIATTLEEVAPPRAKSEVTTTHRGYSARMFPVFP